MKIILLLTLLFISFSGFNQKTINYKDGSVYVGRIVNGQLHGHGKMD